MCKDGPLLPIYFRTIYLSEKEKEAWDWYMEHSLIVTQFIFEGQPYGFGRLHEYVATTPEGFESNHDRGTWLEYNGTVCMDREELRYYV